MEKAKVIVIGGPTASGKTSLSIELAKKINGQIVSADSMQIYKDMNIGTAKPDQEEMQGIKHYLLDCISPEQRYSVADYKLQAKKAIQEILNDGKVPIIVGGTGLYIDSLIYEIEFQDIEIDLKYREELEKVVEEKGLEYVYKEACRIDPKAMEKISSNDQKRILRILEIYKQTGKTKTELDEKSRKDPQYDYRVFAINMDRQVLYDRINRRVDIMLERGLVKEVEELCKKYNEFPTAMQGLGYKEVVEYLNKEISYEEMVEKIKQESRRYAKRQLTWFRKNRQTIWLDGLASTENNIDIIMKEYNKAKEE